MVKVRWVGPDPDSGYEAWDEKENIWRPVSKDWVKESLTHHEVLEFNPQEFKN